MGLTRIRTLTYAWVSQMGMLLGTIVYVNAGTQLARIDSLSGIASPAVLGSFVALGIVPWLAKGIIGVLQRRKVYAGFTRPKTFDRNMVVIGAGAAGLVSSLIAATVKAKVTLVEAHEMGGDCLNTGCVPSKAIIKSAKVAHQMRHADKYGLTPADPEVPFKAVIARVMDTIKTIEPHDSVERYEGLGVDVVKGYAQIIDPWTVEIARNDGGTQRLTTRSIIIASGAEPVVPPIPGDREQRLPDQRDHVAGLCRRWTQPRAHGDAGRRADRVRAFAGACTARLESDSGRNGGRSAGARGCRCVGAGQGGAGGGRRAVLTGHKAVRIEGRVLIAEHAARKCACRSMR
jgi:hypothetical protein